MGGNRRTHMKHVFLVMNMEVRPSERRAQHRRARERANSKNFYCKIRYNIAISCWDQYISLYALHLHSVVARFRNTSEHEL